MKKKLIQILMLLVVAVSVGSFVSCKDTNEDQYNELRTQTAAALSENADLKTALQTLQSDLQTQINNYIALQTQLNALSALHTTDVTRIDGDINTLDGKVNDLTTLAATISQMNADLTEQIKVLTKDLSDLREDENVTEQQVTNLANQISDLSKIVYNNQGILSTLEGLYATKTELGDQAALIAALTETVENLKKAQETAKTCNCEKYTEVLETLATLQTEMSEAKDKINAALTNAGAAQTAATNAQNTADIAKVMAQTATDNAAAALAYAQTVEAKATQAGQDAALAKQKAQDAYDLATLAISAANQANSLADRVLVLEGAVAANTANVENNTKAIDELKTTLQSTTKEIKDLVAANKEELETSIQNVSKELSESIVKLNSDFTESINNLDGKLSESISNLGKELADNVLKIQQNADNIQAITTRIDEYVSRLATAEQNINDINTKISAIETTLGLMPTQIQQAFDAASQAAAKADANSTEISTLKSDVATLNALLQGLETQMNNNNSASQTEIQSLKETTQGLQNAIATLQSTLSGQIGDNSVAIGKLQQAIADMEKAGAKADSTLNKLTEKVDKLVTDLAVLDAEFKAYKIQTANDLETIKNDYKALIEQTKLEIQAWVENALKDYLKKEDVDLTKYVTKEEVANYISKAELDKYATLESLDGYVTQEVFDLVKEKLDGMMPKTEVEAAIQVAISNLANEMLQKFLDLQNGTIADMLQRIATNEEAIDWLKRWHDAIQAKGGSVTNEDLNSWLNIINEKIAAIEAGTSTTVIETIKETVTTEILKEVNSQLTTTIEEVLSDQLINNLDNYNLITTDDIEQIVDNLFDITELKQQLEDLQSKVDNLPGSPDYTDRLNAIEGRIDSLVSATANLAQLQADVIALQNSASTYATKEELQALATKEELAAYAKTSDLLNYVRVDQIAGIIEQYGYLTGDSLEGYAKTSEVTQMLMNYYTSQEVKDYVTEQLGNYVTNTALETKLGDYVTMTYLNAQGYVTVGALTDYLKDYAKTEDLEALRGEFDKYLTLDSFAIEKQALLDAIGTNTTSINDIKTTLTTVTNDIETIKNNIDSIQTRVKATEDKLVELETKYDTAISELKTDISALQDYLAKQVTSIQIQGTKNPWFGTFSTPFGTQSNVLIALYGTPDPFAGKNYFEFPTSISDNYVRTKEALTDADIAMLKESGLTVFKRIANGEACFMYDKGYAGKIYMTINPNTADVTGLQPQIVNSKDEVSYISLDGVKPSTEKLQFGWTRADQSSNGFYEADAIVRPADVQKISAPAFNLPAVKDAAQNVRDALTDLAKSESTGSNRERLEKIADDVNTIVKGLRFDRSGLKVSYDGGGKTNSVYSEYNLAATAFKPLSLETAKDFNYATIPGYEQVNNLLDRVSGRINDQVHTFFKDFSNNALIEKLGNFKIDSIKVPSITDDLLAKFELHMDTVFIIGGLQYEFVMSQEIEVPIKFEKDIVIPIHMNGVEVTVPVKIDKEMEVDLSGVSITSPTVVVTGSATGHAHTDDPDGAGGFKTILRVPIMDSGGNIIGYTDIDLDDVVVDAQIDASGGLKDGETISLEGNPIARVQIEETITGTVDIDTTIVYHLVFEDTFKKTIDIRKFIQLGYDGYEKDPSTQDGYAHDENGDLIPLKDADGNPIPGDKRGFVLRFNYDMRQAAQDLWGMAADALDDINGGLLANVQDLIAEINKQLQSINKYESQLTGMVDDATSRVKDFLDKINRAAVRIINSTNQRFQPFMVASTSKGMKTLSGSKGYPTYLSSDVTLYPSSQTMELFVPFARKHVAVTNVFKGNASAQKGNGECKAVLKAANTGDMNKVLDGTVQQIQMSNLQKGYVYEVAYSALDFHGKMATRKYYISVK